MDSSACITNVILIYRIGLRSGACAGRYVYDGELEGQMTFLTDANKRLIKVSDIYPEDVQLSKGDYIIRAQLRHDDTGSPAQN